MNNQLSFRVTCKALRLALNWSQERAASLIDVTSDDIRHAEGTPKRRTPGKSKEYLQGLIDHVEEKFGPGSASVITQLSRKALNEHLGIEEALHPSPRRPVVSPDALAAFFMTTARERLKAGHEHREISDELVEHWKGNEVMCSPVEVARALGSVLRGADQPIKEFFLQKFVSRLQQFTVGTDVLDAIARHLVPSEAAATDGLFISWTQSHIQRNHAAAAQLSKLITRIDQVLPQARTSVIATWVQSEMAFWEGRFADLEALLSPLRNEYTNLEANSFHDVTWDPLVSVLANVGVARAFQGDQAGANKALDEGRSVALATGKSHTVHHMSVFIAHTMLIGRKYELAHEALNSVLSASDAFPGWQVTAQMISSASHGLSEGDKAKPVHHEQFLRGLVGFSNLFRIGEPYWLTLYARLVHARLSKNNKRWDEYGREFVAHLLARAAAARRETNEGYLKQEIEGQTRALQGELSPTEQPA